MRPEDEDEELVELSAEEIASLQLHKLEMPPMYRGWSSPTFACHRNVSSCLLSCCCPCVQFGLNQHMAFGASCFKWALLYLLPLVAVYVFVDQWLAPRQSAAEMAVAHVMQSVAEQSGGSDAGIERTDAFLYALPVGMSLVALVAMLRRRALRHKYGIGGTAVGDFFCHCCCGCCSLAKEAREIRRQVLDEVTAGAERDLHEMA